MRNSPVDAMQSSIEQVKERLNEKVAGRLGEQPSSDHKPQSYSDTSTTPPVAVPVSGVLVLLKSNFTRYIQLSQ